MEFRPRSSRAFLYSRSLRPCLGGALIPILSFLLTACASTSKAPLTPPPTFGESTVTTSPASAPEPNSAATSKIEDLSPQEQIQKLREKILDLETRLSALNEKINLEASGAPVRRSNGTLPTEEIARDTRGSKILTEHVSPPPAAAQVVPTTRAFVKNELIDRYREAKIQYDAQKFSDSTVEFVSFVKDHPDHPLAPAAQYYVGMGYLRQSELTRAEEELNRGLLNYPHSGFAADTLVALMNIAQKQKKTSRMKYFQQKILGTFPNSPQAVKAALKSTETEMPEPKLVNPTGIESPKAPEAPTVPSLPNSSSPPITNPSGIPSGLPETGASN